MQEQEVVIEWHHEKKPVQISVSEVTRGILLGLDHTYMVSMVIHHLCSGSKPEKMSGADCGYGAPDTRHFQGSRELGAYTR